MYVHEGAQVAVCDGVRRGAALVVGALDRHAHERRRRHCQRHAGDAAGEVDRVQGIRLGLFLLVAHDRSIEEEVTERDELARRKKRKRSGRGYANQDRRKKWKFNLEIGRASSIC